MSWVFYFKPEYKAPFRSDDVEESCVLAYNYFSTLVDFFVANLPEHRQPFDSDDYEPTLADRIHLIFPNGFGEYDEEKNHNPYVWPVLIALSNTCNDGAPEVFQEFVDEVCKYFWDNLNADRQCKDQMQLLQRVFDLLTAYLQLFVVLSDGDSINLDFIYPPEDAMGILLGDRFRKP